MEYPPQISPCEGEGFRYTTTWALIVFYFCVTCVFVRTLIVLPVFCISINLTVLLNTLHKLYTHDVYLSTDDVLSLMSCRFETYIIVVMKYTCLFMESALKWLLPSCFNHKPTFIILKLILNVFTRTTFKL